METDNPFEKVLGRLREKGWAQGATRTRNGRCLVGATTMPILEWWLILRSVVATEYPERRGWATDCMATDCVACFNDHPDTTFSDVERVLEKAAVKWEEKRG